MASPKDFTSFLEAAAPVGHPDLCPEIRLHLAPELSPLWAQQEEWLGSTGLPPPYWGIAWPGGQAMARYLLDNRPDVKGLTMLDLGSGSGVAAIAAAIAGARSVEAADIDSFAREAIAANAALNAVQIRILPHDLVGEAPRWDVILAADLWYERFLAGRVTAWLTNAASQGTRVLLGDGGRAFFPRGRLTELARYPVRSMRSLERDPVTSTGVWAMDPLFLHGSRTERA